MKTAYLGLGSNVGDREAMLQAAVEALESPDLRVRRISPAYETEPLEVVNQPWFLNLVLEVETDLFPMQLLNRVMKIERQLGRRRTLAKGPRTIDIDILFYGGAVVRSANLTIPHPRFGERRFVLAPLADLAPDLRDPLTRKTMREFLGALAGQAARRVDWRPAPRPAQSRL